jgi:cadmium resistance protein CadD (predicted permease)
VNVGPLDRAIRIVLSLALLALIFVGSQSLWGLVGFIPLFTGIAGYCPLYAMLDFSTVGTPHRIRHA